MRVSRPTLLYGALIVEPIDYLWEEYKLLQGKVDSIGAFKFQVKGWAITLIGALLVGGFAANIPPLAFLGCLIVVFLFYIVDSNQNVWHSSYISRIAHLELKLIRVQRGCSDSPKDRSPGVVRATGAAVQTAQRHRRLLLLNEPLIFYGLLALLSIGFTIHSLVRTNPEPRETEVRLVSPVDLKIQGVQQ